jgi:hypothetical protein
MLLYPNRILRSNISRNNNMPLRNLRYSNLSDIIFILIIIFNK